MLLETLYCSVREFDIMQLEHGSELGDVLIGMFCCRESPRWVTVESVGVVLRGGHHEVHIDRHVHLW